MKKLKNKQGMTLLETLAALLITVLLVVAMGSGMDAASGIYERASFAADSNALANVLSTSISDVLRYATNVQHPSKDKDKYSFTSRDYGVQNAKFDILAFDATELDYANSPDKKTGKVVISYATNSVLPLVNDGVYSMVIPNGEDAQPEFNLTVQEFNVKYFAPGEGKNGGGGYFDVSFKIASTKDETKTRDVSFCVRLANT